MGQKTNPNILRLSIIKSWDSIWFSNKNNFVKNLINDDLIRNFLYKNLNKSMISRILIERLSNNIKVTIYTARPGTIIGKKGEDIDKLKKTLTEISKINTQVNIIEIRKPDLDAKLVSNNIKLQIEKRISFRKIIKKSIQSVMKSGAYGVKIKVSGRLGGIEIARSEWYKEGRIPLHTLRADIDYSFSLSKTSYGIIGIKVWIFKGEILNNKTNLNII